MTKRVRFTVTELQALGEACGFRLAGDIDGDDDGQQQAALERAHEKVTLLLDRATRKNGGT